MAEKLTAEKFQEDIDKEAEILYQLDILVQQGYTKEEACKALNYDPLWPIKVRTSPNIYTIYQLLPNKLEDNGRTTIQNRMTDNDKKKNYERILSNLEAANEKKEKILKKSRNFFIVIGCVLGLFYFIGE